MSKKYNVAVIGYGWAATAHIAAINASSQAQVTATLVAKRVDRAEVRRLKHVLPGIEEFATTSQP